MTKLAFETDAISQMTSLVMQAVLAENEKKQTLTEYGLGPLALASALSDFYQISSKSRKYQSDPDIFLLVATISG